MKNISIIGMLCMVNLAPYTHTHPSYTHPFAHDHDDTLAHHMLIQAIANQDTPALLEALKEGAQTDLMLANGWSILHKASVELYCDGIKALLPNNRHLNRRVTYYYTRTECAPARPLECILWSLVHKHNELMSTNPSYTMTHPTEMYRRHWQQYIPLLRLLKDNYPADEDQRTIAHFYNQFITLPGVSDQEPA